MSRRQQRQVDPFPARLREALKDASLTQEQVARDIGVTLRTVQGWASATGTRRPTGLHLVRLAFVLDRAPDWFYDLEEAA